MEWATPQHKRGRVDVAGDTLISDSGFWGDELDHALSVINNWRASHGYPLQALKMTLLGRAKRTDATAIVAQRLKRLSSIAVKLRRNPGMKLSRVQDIGGCRAVVRGIRHLDHLVGLYEAAIEKDSRYRNSACESGRIAMERPQLVKKFDYLTNPKDDGYRSVHFVYKYRSGSEFHSAFNDLRIEIQLRTRLQHAWATAVETVDTFTHQSLKAGGGSEKWRRFFALMGSAIALRERKPLVPTTPQGKSELIEELREAVQYLKVGSVLRGWTAAINYLPKQDTKKAGAFLLLLDPDKKSMQVTGFTNKDMARASDVYLATEKELDGRPSAQAVLVSVESVRALRSAFPNYFADTKAFIEAVNIAIA
jgi:hypothetical protein